MKILLITIFSLSVFAQKIDQKCAVTKIHSDKFDTALEIHGEGDEDYSFIGFTNQPTKVLTIGGFDFKNDSRSNIRMAKQTAASTIVSLRDSAFGELIYSSSATNGCAYISEVLDDGSLKTIVVANCAYRFNLPSRCGAQPDIAL